MADTGRRHTRDKSHKWPWRTEPQNAGLGSCSDRHCLALRTSDLERNPLDILRDRKIGQVELGGIRFAALDGGLDQGNPLFPQNRITLGPAKGAIGVERVQVRALLESGRAATSNSPSSAVLGATRTSVMSCTGFSGAQVSVTLAT